MADLTTKENDIFNLLSEKQSGGFQLSDKETRIFQLLNEKSTSTPSPPSFLEQAGEVAGGALVGGATLLGGAGFGRDVATDLATTGQAVIEGGGDIAQKAVEAEFPIGATVGGIGGGIGGAVVGGVPGAIIGGALGSAGGEAAEIGIRKATGLPAPETKDEIAREITKEALLGAGGEVGGAIIGRVGGRLLRPFQKTILPEAEQAIQFFGDRTNQLLLPAEATENRALDLLQNIAENSLFGGGSIAKFKVGRQALLDKSINEFAEEFGSQASAADIGAMVTGVLNRRINFLDNLAEPFYNTAESLLQGITKTRRIGRTTLTAEAITRPGQVEVGIIPIQNVKNALLKNKKTASELNKFASEFTGSNIVDDLFKLPDDISFAAAKDFRSTLLKMADQFQLERKNAPAVAAMKRIANEMNLTITKTLKEVSPDALSAWQQGNRIIRQKSRDLQNKFLRRLIKIADVDNIPENLISTVFKPGAESNVKNLKNALDSEAWTKIKGWVTRDLVAKATDKEGVLIGKNFDAALFGRSGLGKQVANATYTPTEIKTLRQITNAIELSQAKQAGGTGSIFVQLTQAGAVVKLAQAVGALELARREQLEGAAAILLGPAIIGKVMTNPKTARWLIQGAKAPAGSRQAVRAFNRFVASVAELQFKEQGGVGAPIEPVPPVQ